MEARFPRHLSSPFQVLWFEADEIAISFVFILVALVFGGWLSWALLIVCPYGYIRLKKTYPRGFLRHALYFLGLVEMKGYPGGFERRFLG